MGRSRVGFLQTKPPVRTETAALLRQLGARLKIPICRHGLASEPLD